MDLIFTVETSSTLLIEGEKTSQHGAAISSNDYYTNGNSLVSLNAGREVIPNKNFIIAEPLPIVLMRLFFNAVRRKFHHNQQVMKL